MTKEEHDQCFRILCQQVANNIARENPGVYAMEEWKRNPARMWRITICSIGFSVALCAAIVWVVYRFVPA